MSRSHPVYLSLPNPTSGLDFLSKVKRTWLPYIKVTRDVFQNYNAWDIKQNFKIIIYCSNLTSGFIVVI